MMNNTLDSRVIECAKKEDTNIQKTLVWVSLIILFIVGPSFIQDLYQVWKGDPHTWWTDRNRPLALTDVGDSVEVYINGRLLNKHIEKQSLYLSDGSGRYYRVALEDVKIRRNNWPTVKASLLASTTLTGIALGIAITMLLAAAVYKRRSRTS